MQIVGTDFRQVVLLQQLLEVMRNITRQNNTAIRPNAYEVGVMVFIAVFALICLLLRFQALEVSDYIIHHAEHTVACKGLGVLINEQRTHLSHRIGDNNSLILKIDVAPA